ncbi:MAG: helix-turn-helix domain-containing protein [Ruminococcus sp.]
MLIYKFDIIAKLKEQGYTTYQIRKEKIFSESTLQKFRQKQMISAENLDTLCKVFNMQPGEIIEYIPDDEATHVNS